MVTLLGSETRETVIAPDCVVPVFEQCRVASSVGADDRSRAGCVIPFRSKDTGAASDIVCVACGYRDLVSLGCPAVPSGTVIPLVTCMIPWPQSKETRAGPIDSKRVDFDAIVREDSTQPIARRTSTGIAAMPSARLVRVPTSTAGSLKKESLGKRRFCEAASIISK